MKLLDEGACIMFDGMLFQSAIKMKARAGNLSVPEVAKSKLYKTSPLQKLMLEDKYYGDKAGFPKDVSFE